MTEKVQNTTTNTYLRIFLRLIAALGVIGAIIILVFTGEYISFPAEWMGIVIPFFMVIASFAILIAVAWNEPQY